MTDYNTITLYVLFIVAGVLTTASTIGFILKQRIDHQPHAVIDNLTARIHAWWDGFYFVLCHFARAIRTDCSIYNDFFFCNA